APALERLLLRWPAPADAGIVNEHIEAAEALERGGDDALPVGLLGHIVCERDGLATLLHDCPRDDFAVVAPDVGHDYLRALAGKQASRGLPEPERATRHDGNLALHTVHLFRPFIGRSQRKAPASQRRRRR